MLLKLQDERWLGRTMSIQVGVVAVRRRLLLGRILEEKAAIGAVDVELLHHWLDSSLRSPADRALFGLPLREHVRAATRAARPPIPQRIR